VLALDTCCRSIDDDGVMAMGMMCEIQNAVGLSLGIKDMKIECYR
jgi:hypothetical protein